MCVFDGHSTTTSTKAILVLLGISFAAGAEYAKSIQQLDCLAGNWKVKINRHSNLRAEFNIKLKNSYQVKLLPKPFWECEDHTEGCYLIISTDGSDLDLGCRAGFRSCTTSYRASDQIFFWVSMNIHGQKIDIVLLMEDALEKNKSIGFPICFTAIYYCRFFIMEKSQMDICCKKKDSLYY